MKARIAIGLLVAALIFVTFVAYREAQVIAIQRHLILQLWSYVQQYCSANQ